MKLFEKNFLFADTAFHPGSWNMQFDIRRAQAMQQGGGAPLLRVYGWNPWCISLGRNQAIDDIDVERVYRDGYDVVHRPTGGRAIFHAEELTYSVIMPLGGRSPMDLYRSIGEALVAGLQYMAPGIDQVKSQPDFNKLYKEPRGIPCFSSSARYEIEYEGRKLIGSAQRVFGTSNEDSVQVVLQHGSILIGDAHLALADYLRVDEVTRRALSHDMRSHTVTLREICGRSVSYMELAASLRRGFEEAWNVEFGVEDSPDTYLTTEVTESLP